jgi:hypothetical protein
MSKELEERYRPILTELSKCVGAAANSGDIQAYKFLIDHILIIMQTGFDILKDVHKEYMPNTMEDFFKIVSKK